MNEPIETVAEYDRRKLIEAEKEIERLRTVLRQIRDVQPMGRPWHLVCLRLSDLAAKGVYGD